MWLLHTFVIILSVLSLDPSQAHNIARRHVFEDNENTPAIAENEIVPADEERSKLTKEVPKILEKYIIEPFSTDGKVSKDDPNQLVNDNVHFEKPSDEEASIVNGLDPRSSFITITTEKAMKIFGERENVKISVDELRSSYNQEKTGDEATEETTEEITEEAIEERTIEKTGRETEEITKETTRVETKEATEEKTERITEETTKGTTKQKTEGETEETPKETTKEKTEGETDETTKKKTEEANKETNKEKTEEATKGTAKQTTKETTKEATERTTKHTIEETTRGKTEGELAETTKDNTNEKTEKATEGTSKQTTEERTKEETEGTTKQITEEKAKEKTELTTEWATSGGSNEAKTVEKMKMKEVRVEKSDELKKVDNEEGPNIEDSNKNLNKMDIIEDITVITTTNTELNNLNGNKSIENTKHNNENKITKVESTKDEDANGDNSYRIIDLIIESKNSKLEAKKDGNKKENKEIEYITPTKDEPVETRENLEAPIQNITNNQTTNTAKQINNRNTTNANFITPLFSYLPLYPTWFLSSLNPLNASRVNHTAQPQPLLGFLLVPFMRPSQQQGPQQAQPQLHNFNDNFARHGLFKKFFQFNTNPDWDITKFKKNKFAGKHDNGNPNPDDENQNPEKIHILFPMKYKHFKKEEQQQPGQPEQPGQPGQQQAHYKHPWHNKKVNNKLDNDDNNNNNNNNKNNNIFNDDSLRIFYDEQKGFYFIRPIIKIEEERPYFQRSTNTRTKTNDNADDNANAKKTSLMLEVEVPNPIFKFVKSIYNYFTK